MSVKPISPTRLLASVERTVPDFVIETINTLLREEKSKEDVNVIGPITITEAQIVERLEPKAKMIGVQLDDLAWQDFIYVFAESWDLSVVFSQTTIELTALFWKKTIKTDPEIYFEFSPKGVQYDS